MNVAGLEHVIGRPDAEVIDVIRDVDPAVRHAGRDDDDIARFHLSLDDVRPGNDAAARWAVEHLGDIAVGRRLAAIHDVAAGHQRDAAGHRTDATATIRSIFLFIASLLETRAYYTSAAVDRAKVPAHDCCCSAIIRPSK